MHRRTGYKTCKLRRAIKESRKRLDHEANYTPTKWSKRFDQMRILVQHYKLAKNVTENSRKNLECELDIAYGTTDRTKYDIFGTDLPKDAPLFVFIHGGYWQEGSKDTAAFAAPVFTRKGVKVVTIVNFEDIMSQIKMAVEQILKFAFSLGSRGVWISGHSAGAHLASSLLFDQLWMEKMAEKGCLSLLKGIVLISGIYNLNQLVNTTIINNLKLTKDEIKAYSLTTLDIKNNKPIQGLKVIVTVGECESPGFINESRECVQKLITVVDNVQYILLRDNIDHFNIVENFTDEEFILTKVILNSIFYNS
nr:PREDICTED: kynurenine formamidase isoform X2 [Megachile rotundata]